MTKEEMEEKGRPKKMPKDEEKRRRRSVLHAMARTSSRDDRPIDSKCSLFYISVCVIITSFLLLPHVGSNQCSDIFILTYFPSPELTAFLHPVPSLR